MSKTVRIAAPARGAAITAAVAETTAGRTSCAYRPGGEVRVEPRHSGAGVNDFLFTAYPTEALLRLHEVAGAGQPPLTSDANSLLYTPGMEESGGLSAKKVACSAALSGGRAQGEGAQDAQPGYSQARSARSGGFQAVISFDLNGFQADHRRHPAVSPA